MNSTASVQLELHFFTEETTLITKRQSRGAGGKGHWEGSHYISRGQTGHWSKWGGAKKDLIQELEDTWVCQSCGEHYQKPTLPYSFEYPKGEYLRVCHVCNDDGCQILKLRAGII